MNTNSETTQENPLDEFSGCHEGIIKNINRLRDLAAIVADSPDNPEIREPA